MHLAFEPNGRVVPCCLTSTKASNASNLNTQTIDQIWNSPEQRDLRRTMMAGEKPSMCDKCFKQEEVTGLSGRVHHNREFPHVVKSIPDITQPDGTVTEMKLRYWDFRFSNLCNFKCRSCGPAFSSAWVPDGKAMGWVYNPPKVTIINGVEGKPNYDFLEEQAQFVEKIYFAGGEPLLMEEHWQILDMLVKHKRFDVRLSYNTNASTLKHGKKNVLDYWKQWQPGKVEVWPSIDEVGERAELIRSGTVWKIVERNLKALVDTENLIVRPGITTGAMNVFRLPEIIDHLTNVGVIGPKNGYNFYINLLEEPKNYHVHILSDKFRAEIVARLDDWIIDYNQRHRVNITDRFAQIKHELAKPHSMIDKLSFISMTKRLDGIRNENIYEVIPELRDVLS
jgi:MoaA/NifB/PqqE/SkfB family radical SAM enzyme